MKCPAPTVYPNIFYDLNTATGMCERTIPDKLTISLVIGSEVEPLKSIWSKVLVKGPDGPKGGIPVSLILDVNTTSGGHDHGESTIVDGVTIKTVRPRGGLPGATATGCPSTAPPNSVCASVVTSDKEPNIGEANFNFSAPAVSGTHTLSATCTGCTNTVTSSIKVMVPNLTTLTASSDYVLVGGGTDKKHTDNHWLTATAKENLLAIVEKYNKKYPAGPLLRLNDASLIWGGKFDIAGNWGGEHKEHRRGDVIDIRANQDFTAIPEANFKDFQTFASQSGGAFASLHCNPPYSRTCPGCILDTGTNRHFHVYLLGK